MNSTQAYFRSYYSRFSLRDQLAISECVWQLSYSSTETHAIELLISLFDLSDLPDYGCVFRFHHCLKKGRLEDYLLCCCSLLFVTSYKEQPTIYT